MSYLFETYWGWALLALLLGLVIGWLATQHSVKHFHWVAKWLNAALWLFAAGLIIAIFKLLPGRAGLWLETALMFFAAYLIGCLLSAWMKSIASPPITHTAAGLMSGLAENDDPGLGTIGTAGIKPLGIARPSGMLDNLKLISGIGRKNEEKLHDLGIYHFSQIAQWSNAEISWIEHHLSFPGRIEHENWRGQASKLAQGIETEFAKRVKEGKVDMSKDIFDQ